jgi:DNA invertase Pin-like site-specific DNA recombinase
MNNKNNKTNEASKICFSYIRFSSAKQSKGNSFERQLEIAPRVALEKGWTFRQDLSLNSLEMSGYHGSNLGAIKGLIEGTKDGRIPKGSVCILEALDRLTRLDVDTAYQLLRELVISGLEIYTDNSSRHITEKDLKNPMSIMMTVVELNAGFEYSDKLSDRVGKAWARKRKALAETGKPLTKMIVGWVDGKTGKPNDRANVVNRIFEMYNSGHGISAIVRILNQEKVKTWGRGKSGHWNCSYLSELLHSRAVIGEFQPHITKRAEKGNYYKRFKSGEPIKGYYPAIVPEKLFYEVQAKIGDSRKGPKTENIGNLFSGVAYCECGEKMYLVNSNKKGDARKYYTCWGKVKGLGCQALTIRYEPLENFFLMTAAKNAEKLFAVKSPSRERAEMIRGQVMTIEKQIEHITPFFLQGRGSITLGNALEKLETELNELNQELAIETAKFTANVQNPMVDFREITIKDLANSIEVRRKVRSFALAYVERIEFPLDRQTMGIQFKNDAMAGMFQQSLAEL